MASKEPHYTSSGSKSRDTRGAEPSQDDVKKKLQGSAKDRPSDGRIHMSEVRGGSEDDERLELDDQGGLQGSPEDGGARKSP